MTGKGHKIEVIAGSFTNKNLVGKVEPFLDKGAPVFFVPLLPCPKLRGVNMASYTLPTLSTISFMAKRLLQEKEALIHLHGLSHPIIDFAAFICIMLRRKFVVTCHGIPTTPAKAHRLIGILFRLYLTTVEGTISKCASAVTFVSKTLMKECIARGITNRTMKVIPNGLDQNLSSATAKSLDAINEKYELRGKQVIFTIGRLNPSKGFQHLIEAMGYVASKLPNALAIIAGSGPYRSVLEGSIFQRKLRDQIKLVGKISEEEKAAFYKRSDVVVFPSISEPFGLVILEAFAMQKPVIAFNTESAREIIGDKTDGLLVSSRDGKKLAEAIVEVLTDVELRDMLIENIGRKIGAFRWEEIVQMYETTYEEACCRSYTNFGAG